MVSSVQDFNKQKKLDVDSVSGTPTVDKATPIILKGEGTFRTSSISFVDSKDLSNESLTTTGAAFNNTGSKLYVTEANGTVFEYNLSTNYDVSTATFNQSLDVSVFAETPDDIIWNDDGTSFYLPDSNDGEVFQYDLSTAFDISTAGPVAPLDVSSETGNPTGVSFSNNGDLLFVSAGDQNVYKYSLSTSYDVSTGSFIQSSDFGSEVSDLVDITVKSSGKDLHLIGSVDNKIFEYEFGDNKIFEYEFGAVNDLTTTNFQSSESVSEDSDPQGLLWNDDGLKVYMVGTGSDAIYEYDTGSLESKTGNGDIVIDFTNISDAQDIAVYDENGNLLDYEIESLDTAAETGVIWAYDSWVRDGTTQAQIVYGNNSANEDRSVDGTGSNPWENGQNAVMVQHLQDDPLTATDSTANNNDGTVNGATATTGQFDGAASFDGADDYIDLGTPFSTFSSLTVIGWGKFNNFGTDMDSPHDLWSFSPEDSYDNWMQISGNSNNILRFGLRNDGGTLEFVDANNAINFTDTFYQITGRWDGSNIESVLDGSQVASGNLTGTIDLTSIPSYIGAKPGTGGVNTNRVVDGIVDEIRVYSDYKNDNWIQADYDASPKAGQVFFTQQAAETTSTAVSAIVSDSLGFSEIQASTLSFTASDNLSVQGNQQGQLSDIVSDSLEFNEATKSSLVDSLVDQLGFTEQTSSRIVDEIVESLGFSENINAQLALTVLTSDSLGFTENIESRLRDALTDQLDVQGNVESRLVDSLADQIGFTEAVQPAIAQTLQDQLGFNEAAAAQVVEVVTDQLTLSSDIDGELQDTLSRQLDFSEDVAASIAVTVSDQLQFDDKVIQLIERTLSDDLGFTENVASAVAEKISDQLSFQDQVLFASLLNIDGLTEAILNKPNRFVTMQNRTFKEGDLGDELQATLRDKNGKIDLSQVSSVDFVARDTKKTKVLDEQVTISDPANGEIQYQWRQGDFIEDAGIYQAEFRINDNAGNTETVPNDGHVTIEIEEEIK